MSVSYQDLSYRTWGTPCCKPQCGGCCYLGYFQTLEEDGTKGAGDTTCDHFRIPFACQPVEEGESSAGGHGAVGELAAFGDGDVHLISQQALGLL